MDGVLHIHMEPQRRAEAYRAIADILAMPPVDPVNAVMRLASTSCPHPAMELDFDKERRAAKQWAASGRSDVDELARELRTLFGDGLCEKSFPVVPACEAFYGAGADEVRRTLEPIQQRVGYTPATYWAPCEGPGYVSHELALLARCLDEPEFDESARIVADEHALTWVPLFSAALFRAAVHPALRFAAIALECVMAAERGAVSERGMEETVTPR